MKKTLLVTVDYPPRLGGVSSYWKQVTKSLSSDMLTVLTDQEGESVDGRMTQKLFYRWFWPKWLRGVFAIRKGMHASGAKQILAAQLLPVGNMVWFYTRFARMPYYVQVYGMDILQAKLSRRKAWLARRILNDAHGIIANSEAVAKLVSEFCPSQSSIQVVHPIPEPPKHASDEDVKALKARYELGGRPVILTIGRLVARKGQDKVLAAMLHVWQKYPHAVYVIVGDGPDNRRLRKMAAPHAEKVIFTGEVSEQEKNAWLEIADIFVMVSREMPGDIEGFGMVYLEANYMGIPVIAGESGGVGEAVLHQKTGLLVPPEDTDAIAVALLRLLENPDEAKLLGRQGRERLLHELTWAGELEKFKGFLG